MVHMNRMNRNHNNIIRPDAMNIETTFMAGPLAQPVAINAQVPGGVKILAIGGLTKAEQLAGQIAGNLAGTICRPPAEFLIRPDEKPGATVDRDAEFERRVAFGALNIAEAILEESARRQIERQAQQATEPT